MGIKAATAAYERWLREHGCLRFQNGFFWQTVLKRESDRTTSARPGPANKRSG
jgi:hypothetical protein